MSNLFQIIVTNGFAIIGVIATTRWILRKLDGAQAWCIRRALSPSEKGDGHG